MAELVGEERRRKAKFRAERRIMEGEKYICIRTTRAWEYVDKVLYRSDAQYEHVGG